MEDSYVCVLEAIKHASWDLGVSPEIVWFNSEDLENPEIAQKVENELKQANGIIVPQGWGSRGVEGKVKTVQIARENKIPYLGLCFGMQMAVIEYARNVLGLSNANSEEVNPKTPFPVIHIMENQREYLAKQNYGGTIRLGAWPCVLKKGSMLEKIYSQSNFDQENSPLGITVWERHRHRYEVNNEFKSALEEKGLIISGISPDGNLVEAVELPSEIHPFFVGTQFHPEYKSRPLAPHPLFKAFIQKGKENLQNCR